MSVRPMRPKILLRALAQAQVDYVLIGGLAAVLQGGTRVTSDIDLAYSMHDENLQRLCKVINAFSPQRIVLGVPSGSVMTIKPELLREERRMNLSTDVGEIDLLDRPDGFPSYGLVKKLSEVLDAGGIPVRTLSVDGLLRAKNALKRPKDVQDIIELEAIKELRQIDTESASIRLRDLG